MAEITGWFTINGVHIPIMEGQTKATAMKAYIDKQVKKQASAKAKSNSTKSSKDNKDNKISDTERKEKQFEIIKKNNAMTDDYHTGIRSAKDIKTAIEAFKTKVDEDEDYLYPDFKKSDGLKALESGKITVYSSKEIKQGSFVSPSKMMAEDYAGNGKVFSKTISINDVAWVDSNEGQFAKV